MPFDANGLAQVMQLDLMPTRWLALARGLPVGCRPRLLRPPPPTRHRPHKRTGARGPRTAHLPLPVAAGEQYVVEEGRALQRYDGPNVSLTQGRRAQGA